MTRTHNKNVMGPGMTDPDFIEWIQRAIIRNPVVAKTWGAALSNGWNREQFLQHVAEDLMQEYHELFSRLMTLAELCPIEGGYCPPSPELSAMLARLEGR